MKKKNRIEDVRSENFIQRIYLRKLVDLGKIDEILSGILSPLYDDREISRFMSNHYKTTEKAELQNKCFDLRFYYQELIDDTLKRIGFSHPEKMQPLVLELGSGFGSATFPLLSLFPKGRVIATDLSTAMLLVLKKKLIDTKFSKRCYLIQLNAEKCDFQPNSFDFVFGAALLHHLFHPEKVLELVAKILKPDGYAIFFEPFENGYSIMSLIYNSILSDIRALFMKRRTRRYFHTCIGTWESMKNPDKSKPFFRGRDDKWLFTYRYFHYLTKLYGFRQCQIYPLDKSNRPYETLAKTHFSGNKVEGIHKWIWKIIDKYESSFSDELKKDLLTEGCVVLNK